MKKENSSQVLLLYLILMIGLLIVYFSEYLLPDKYFIDSNTIKYYYTLLNGFSLKITDGFYNTALFYKILGFESIKSRIIEGSINYIIYFVCLLVVFKFIGFNLNKIYNFFLLLIWSVIASIYLGQLTKEIILLLVLTSQLMAFHKNSKIGIVLSIIMTLLYAYFFRKYWFITIFLCTLIFYLLKYGYKVKILYRFLIVFFCMFIIVCVANYYGIYLTDSRTLVNEILESNTKIENPLQNNSIFTDLFNWIYIWFSLLVPIPLLLKYGIIQTAFSLLNIVTVATFLLKIKRHKYSIPESLGFLWSISTVISFSLVQAIFEPDYGSYVKHEVVLIPMLLYIICQKDQKAAQK
ncbi:hypothetical protein [Heyndrickxia coagulans]|uniref:Uncharacterized protein n=1 Tax=Heyndrickxia coagulans TaxID=1398 RepID=A0A133L061_HEYCO|nr:hypothetical protein [Heyndrickxia coagulans]KWZ85251.1 hypothetical protein HMPREF3213_00545 [Heyndrickxia coagulans]